MKKLIGAVIVLLSIAFFAVLVLRIWGINMISTENVLRSGVTLILLGILIVLLIIIYGFFYRKNDAAYSLKIGNRAHPKLKN